MDDTPAAPASASPRIISVMNQKGGVGKTTTALNLGAALALRGKRTLLIDLDPQANLTHGLNRRAADLSQCIYELLISPKPDARALVQRTAYERLDLIPSHIDVSGAEIELVPMIGRETRLKRAIEVLLPDYDYILIDCLPALSLLTVNALVASGEALVPLQAHPFAMEGLGKLFEVVGMIREALNARLHVSGVLVTLFDARTNVSRETLERLRHDERLAPHLFDTVVRMNIKIAESQNHGVPVVHYDPRSPGALAYLALCEEVLEMEACGCLASEARRRIAAREPAASESGESVHRRDAETQRTEPLTEQPPQPSAPPQVSGEDKTESPSVPPAPGPEPEPEMAGPGPLGVPPEAAVEPVSVDSAPETAAGNADPQVGQSTVPSWGSALPAAPQAEQVPADPEPADAAVAADPTLATTAPEPLGVAPEPVEDPVAADPAPEAGAQAEQVPAEPTPADEREAAALLAEALREAWRSRKSAEPAPATPSATAIPEAPAPAPSAIPAPAPPPAPPSLRERLEDYYDLDFRPRLHLVPLAKPAPLPSPQSPADKER